MNRLNYTTTTITATNILSYHEGRISSEAKVLVDLPSPFKVGCQAGAA